MDWMELAWLVPLLPLVASGLVAAFGKRLPWKGAEIAIVAVAAAFVISVGIALHTFFNSPIEPLEKIFRWAPLGDGITLELGMLVDGLTAMMFLLVTLVSLMVQIYSREYMHGEPRFTYFFAMLSLFTASMLILVIANNTLQAIVGWELVGVCSYLLIGFYWEEKSNQDAANKAFLTTKFADVGLIVGVIVLSKAMFDISGTPFNILELNGAAASGALDQGLVVLGALLIFGGAIGKSGQMPLHVWLPDAMAGPTPVSALIHAATMVTAGVFLVARLFPVFAQSLAVMTTIAVIGTITLFFAGFLALVEDDIKKVLAYSTISQLGYMVAALGVGGYTAGIFHLFTHGFFKALLFLGSGSLIHAVHSNNMTDMGGMRRFMPHTFWTFIAGSLALAGFPLTAGFFSKDEVLVSAQLWGDAGFAAGPLVFWLGLAAAGVTTFYMARACFLIFWGEYRGSGAIHHGEQDTEAHPELPAPKTPHESGRLITVPLIVLAVLSLTVGWIGSPFWSEDDNFEQWTATPILEEASYPFVGATTGLDEHGEEDTETHGLAPLAAGAAAAPVLAATEGEGDDADEGHGAGALLHGPPEFEAFVAGLAFAIFALALLVAWRIYGRGKPDEDPMFKMGVATKALVNRYWFDEIGYRYIVVPVRDQLAKAAYWSNQEVLDAAVKGAGGAAKRIADVTYGTVDQRIIDGGVNGAAFSAAWWSDKLKRIQAGNVQRYAGALVAGVIVLVLVFAAST
ncbi:MAG: NADH-quinone oxidoreductase subunit L [Actinobacteria bacterium]|nr:NADH-quinone oxidoreductase subunit L [Actinomycetota bacterium]